MVHGPFVDFDELFPETCQRPVRHRLRQRLPAQEVAEIVGLPMKMQLNGIGGEGAT